MCCGFANYKEKREEFYMAIRRDIFEARKKLLKVDYASEKLEETIRDCMKERDDLGSSLGDKVLLVIKDCTNEDELKLVDKTLEAVTGKNLESILGIINERDKTGYDWEFDGPDESYTER